MAELGFQRFFAGPYFHKGEFRKAGGIYNWLIMEAHLTYTLVSQNIFKQLTKHPS